MCQVARANFLSSSKDWTYKALKSLVLSQLKHILTFKHANSPSDFNGSIYMLKVKCVLKCAAGAGPEHSGTHSTKVWSPPKPHPRQGFHSSQAGHGWAGASSPWNFPLHPSRRFCPCHLRYPSGIWRLDKAERRRKVRWWSEKMIAAGTSQPKAFGHLTHLPLILSTASTQRAGGSPFPKLHAGRSSSKCREGPGSRGWQQSFQEQARTPEKKESHKVFDCLEWQQHFCTWQRRWPPAAASTKGD